MKIGFKLKEARLKKELTQENVANILNVSRSTVSSWEVGRSYPDLENLVALSDLYNISLDKILREDSDMVKKLSFDLKIAKKINQLFILIAIISFIIVGLSIFKSYKISEKKDVILDSIDTKINSLVTNNIQDNSDIFEKELPEFLKSEKFKTVTYMKIFTGAPNSLIDIDTKGFDFSTMKLNYFYDNKYLDGSGGQGQLTDNITKDDSKVYYEVGIDVKEYNMYDTLFQTFLSIGLVSLIASLVLLIASRINKSS